MTENKMQSSLKCNDNSAAHHRIFVAIVSHYNEEDILESLKPHQWLLESRAIKPIILSNVYSERLTQYCEQHGITYVENQTEKGFGANNNTIYRLAKNHFNINPQDYLFCINPDIKTSAKTIETLAKIMQENKLNIAAPNLLDRLNLPDDNLRIYPTFRDIFLRFALKSARTKIDKSKIKQITPVDWASGAFLCFRSDVYKRLGGFDERYFMYYEDADICRRGARMDEKTYYIPDLTAIHFANRKSRSLFSKSFIWHVQSALKFLRSKNQ